MTHRLEDCGKRLTSPHPHNCNLCKTTGCEFYKEKDSFRGITDRDGSLITPLRFTLTHGCECFSDGLTKSEELSSNHLRIALKIARNALNRDKTGLASTIAQMLKIIEAYEWIPKGEWGSYIHSERTSKTLQKEIGNAFEELKKIGEGGLKQSGNLATTEIQKIDKTLVEFKNGV